MTIELSKEAKQTALESLQKYFAENLDEPLGNLAAGALLGFILEEIGPSIYNKASPLRRSVCRRGSANWNTKFTPTNFNTGENQKGAGDYASISTPTRHCSGFKPRREARRGSSAHKRGLEENAR